jgi:hypothetical protein
VLSSSSCWHLEEQRCSQHWSAALAARLLLLGQAVLAVLLRAELQLAVGGVVPVGAAVARVWSSFVMYAVGAGSEQEQGREAWRRAVEWPRVYNRPCLYLYHSNGSSVLELGLARTTSFLLARHAASMRCMQPDAVPID